MNFGAERLGIAKKDLASRYDKRVTDVWGGTIQVPWGRSEQIAADPPAEVADIVFSGSRIGRMSYD